MDCLFAVGAPVVMVPEAGDCGLRDYDVFLVVVGILTAGGDVDRRTFRAFIDADIFMLIDSIRNLPGRALVA